MAKQLQQPANSVPAFIFCGQMIVGYDQVETKGRELEKKLLACHQLKNGQRDQAQEHFNIPWMGEVHYQDFSLPVFTLVIAALDAFNPCAFFVLFFLISLMVRLQSRARMLVIGFTFVICSGLMYFLFMSAWLNLFLITRKNRDRFIFTMFTEKIEKINLSPFFTIWLHRRNDVTNNHAIDPNSYTSPDLTEITCGCENN